MSKLVIKYVWEIPVRVTHWLNVLLILTLSVTGYLIGNPHTFAQHTSQFVMGWIRFIHFTCAYTFAIGLAVRIYWSFVGNRYSSWRTFFPWVTPDGRRKIWATFKYYSFFSRRLPHVVGHNALAATAYSVVMSLYLLMVITGFFLYAEHSNRGILHAMFGWIGAIVSNQSIRLVHHMGMWLLLGFAIHHVYSSWLMDIKERGGIISSMFSGYKSVEED